MQPGKSFLCASTDGVDFTGACAQNAALTADLTLPSAVGGGDQATSLITSVLLYSSLNNAWDVQFFRAHDGPSANPNVDMLAGLYPFKTGHASVGVGGIYYYMVDGLEIAYADVDLDQHLGAAKNVPQLHVRIINRSAAIKPSYGAGGHLRLVVTLQPTLGGY